MTEGRAASEGGYGWLKFHEEEEEEQESGFGVGQTEESVRNLMHVSLGNPKLVFRLQVLHCQNLLRLPCNQCNYYFRSKYKGKSNRRSSFGPSLDRVSMEHSQQGRCQMTTHKGRQTQQLMSQLSTIDNEDKAWTIVCDQLSPNRCG